MCQASVTVNNVTPTAYTYTATQQAGSITEGCSGLGSGPVFTMGCGFDNPGILFNASLQGPTQFISSASDSGIYMVQLLSIYDRGHDSSAGDVCSITRTTPFDVDSGWKIDGANPYNLRQTFGQFDANGFVKIVSRPLANGTVVDGTADSPGFNISALDALRFDQHYEMYLVYFTGNERQPKFQRAIAKIPWYWRGYALFSSPGVWNYYESFPPSGSLQAVPVSEIRSYNGVHTETHFNSCAPLPNSIDDARKFVHQQYSDFLPYEPEEAGWNYWTAEVDRYSDDQQTSDKRRAEVSLAFFYAAPFMQEPAFAQQNTEAYNDAFVTYCYRRYLQREPDESGRQFWVGILNSQISTGSDYRGVVRAFITSVEYRSRFGSP